VVAHRVFNTESPCSAVHAPGRDVEIIARVVGWVMTVSLSIVAIAISATGPPLVGVPTGSGSPAEGMFHAWTMRSPSGLQYAMLRVPSFHGAA
jgi:hypothetical protein